MDTKERYLERLLWNCLQVNATRQQKWLVNIGSGNGLVSSDKKPLYELILTKFYDAVWCY